MKAINLTFTSSLIENNISCVKTEISALKSDNTVLRTNMGEMERFCQSASDFIDKTNTSITSTSTYIKTLEQENKSLRNDFATLKTTNEGLESSVTSLKEKILEMEARSMQCNLLFFGIGERAENIRNKTFREPTEVLVKDFMRNEMVFEQENYLDPDAIEFDRIHRLGKPKFDRQGRLLRPRPIVAAFKNYRERECVRRAASTIQNRQFSVREQFPTELEERRKKLYPFMQSAKRDTNNDVKLVRDKLIINGKTYTHTDILEEGDETDNRRVPLKNNRPRGPPQAINIGWGSRVARPVFPKNSGAIPKLNFLSNNMYTPLRELGNDSTVGPGKKKASSPLEDQTSPKKLRDAPPANPRNGGASDDVTEKDSDPTPTQDDEPIHSSSTQQQETSDLSTANGSLSGDNNGATGSSENNAPVSPTMDHT